MVIDLLGVFDDGSPLAPTVPANPRQQINVVQGASITIRGTYVRNDGSPVWLAQDPNFSLVLSVSKNTFQSNGFPLLKFTGVLDPTRGVNAANFTIAPGELRFYTSPGRYVYDVWLTYQGVRNPVNPLAPFVVQPAALLVP